MRFSLHTEDFPPLALAQLAHMMLSLPSIQTTYHSDILSDCLSILVDDLAQILIAFLEVVGMFSGLYLDESGIIYVYLGYPNIFGFP